MKIIIAAGTGFLGKNLDKYFTTLGHKVIILTRNPSKTNHIRWDGKSLGNWISHLEGADVLINLAGKSVDCRYTEENRSEILRSRIDSTHVLQQAVDQLTHPPKLWLNASSATIYIHAETQQMDEESGIIGDDFSMGICKQWEAEFFKINNTLTRKVALRTSIVLGEDGGAYPKMKMISRMGLGGYQGHGRQMMSYIWIEDFCRAIDFIISRDDITGPINITSPHPMSNNDFMNKLATHTKPLFKLPSPIWLLEIASIFLRTETELLLKSRNVIPKILNEKGFKWQNG
jgi:uncharacterized protein